MSRTAALSNMLLHYKEFWECYLFRKGVVLCKGRFDLQKFVVVERSMNFSLYQVNHLFNKSLRSQTLK